MDIVKIWIWIWIYIYMDMDMDMDMEWLRSWSKDEVEQIIYVINFHKPKNFTV